MIYLGLKKFKFTFAIIFTALVLLFDTVRAEEKTTYSLYDKPIDTLKQEAQSGSKRAQYKMGLAYLRGDQVDLDVSKAILWLKKSADQGYVKAYHKLGMIYFDNKDGSRNYGKAFKWILRAAKKDYGISQYYLSLMYFEGRGVKKDAERAYHWAAQAQKNKVPNIDTLIAKIEAVIKKNKSVYTDHHANTMQAGTGQSSAQKERVSSAERVKRMINHIIKPAWVNGDKQAETLPSAQTECKIVSNSIQCESKRIISNNENYLLHYKVESLITDFQKNNQFFIRYRYEYLFVMPHDSDDPNPSYIMPKMGTKTALLNLNCKLHNSGLITCINDTGQKIRYTK